MDSYQNDRELDVNGLKSWTIHLKRIYRLELYENVIKKNEEVEILNYKLPSWSQREMGKWTL